MANAWRFGCGGSGIPEGDGKPVSLALYPSNSSTAVSQTGNVRLGIESIRRSLLTECPADLLDLLELATYVYVADQVAARGRPTDLGACWRRTLSFRVPVRNPDRWNSRVTAPLVETLEFLSEDEYRFEFVLHAPDPPPPYFTFGGERFDRPVDEIVPFSGGMDSLAGAVEEAVINKRHVALVQHRSNPKLQPRHDELLAALQKRVAKSGGEISHFPVLVNKHEELTAESTQRSRSFLFVSLAAAVGSMVGGPDRIRFYENGVVGLNLPLTPAAVGARSTRTTHPRTLSGFAKILSAVTGRPFEVESPFLWETRTDVVRRLLGADCGELLTLSTSCGATRGMTVKQPHCGMCSQCVGRRFAILAAKRGIDNPTELSKIEASDSPDGYRIDVLTGDRADGDPRLILAAFLDAAERVERARVPADLFALFGEAARVLRTVDITADEVARRVFDLYQRHANDVNWVLDQAGGQYARDLRLKKLPAGCTLRLVFDKGQSLPVEPPASKPTKKAKKRGPRTAKIEKIQLALVERIRAARDHADATREVGGVPELLPRPSQQELAKELGMTEPALSRCLNDPKAPVLKRLWELSDDLNAVMNFRGVPGAGSEA